MQVAQKTQQKFIYTLLFVVLCVTTLLASTSNYTSAVSETTWYNNHGQGFSAQYLNNNQDFFHQFFTVVNTHTILDNGTKQLYVSASEPAYDLSSKSGQYFAYWPVDGNGKIISQAVNGHCLGGFIYYSGDSKLSSSVTFYEPDLDSNTNSCTINNKSITNYTGNVTDELGGLNLADGVNYTNLNEERILASPFVWKSKDEIQVAGWGTSLTRLDGKHTQPGQLSRIQQDLGNIGNSGGGGIFSTDGCVENGFFKSFLVVDSSNPQVVSLYHYKDGKTDAGTPILTDWYSKGQLDCLFGGNQYPNNPLSNITKNDNITGQDVSGSNNVAYVGDISNASKPPPSDLKYATGVDQNTGGSKDQDPCEDVSSGIGWDTLGHPIKWFECAIAGWAGNAADKFSGMVSNLLNFDPFRSNSSNLQTTWSAIRNIANALFVVALLIIIISEAMGVGLLDAYTIKKMLPKLIIAIILANLSFSLCGIVIHYINIIGGAIGHAILSPFGNLNSAIASTNNTGGAAALSMGLGGVVVVGVSIAIISVISTGGIGLAPVLIALLTILVALLVAYITLLIRQIAIVLLVIFSPLVMAAWVLPGGDKMLGKWWKFFSELLLMYPIIMAMLAAGQVVAAIMTPASGGTGSNGGVPANSFMAILAIFLPYFLIPAVFKMASSTLSNITGMVNDKGKGLLDKGKNWRDNGSQWGWRKQQRQNARKYRQGEKGLGSLENGRFANFRRRNVSGINGITSRKNGIKSATSQAILGNMQSQQEKQQDEAALAALNYQNRNLPRDKILDNLDEVAKSSSSTSAQKRAAIKMLTQQKATDRLEGVQEHMAANGDEVTWNRAMSENYGDFQAFAPGLATPISNGDKRDAIQKRRLEKVSGISDSMIADMHNDTWKSLATNYGDIGRQVAIERYNRIVGNDPNNPTNPRLAGQLSEDTKKLIEGLKNRPAAGPHGPEAGPFRPMNQ